MADQGEKTEKPTGRKLKDARSKGQIARSRDLAQVAALLATLWCLASLGPSTVQSLGNAIVGTLRSLDHAGTHDIDAAGLGQLLSQNLWALTAICGPVAAAAAVAIVAANTLQGGFVLSPEALKPDLGRLSPSRGLQRLGIGRVGPDLLKTTLVAGVLTYISYKGLRTIVEQAVPLAHITPMRSAIAAWDATTALLRSSATVLGVAALADYGVQWWRTNESLKMTKQEVRDDTRLSEGNPENKARVRKVQREVQRRRMVRAAAKATVVITNPTHFAVALKYDRLQMSAPQVVAKGQGLLAARIKAIAIEHGVPTVENVPLAQALYKGVEVGETIPAALFKAVAEVLSYLIRVKQLSL